MNEGTPIERIHNTDFEANSFNPCNYSYSLGNLTNPLPSKLKSVTLINVQFAESNLKEAGWTIITIVHKHSKRGIGRRIVAKFDIKNDGILTTLVRRYNTQYIQNGLAVLAR